MKCAPVLRLLLLMASATPAATMPAAAGVTAGQLEAVAATPQPNAALPLNLGFIDESGRATTLGRAIDGVPAAVIVFADYTCHTLCGPILEFTADALAKTGLRPGADYRLVTIGLDPKDGPDTARAMRAAHIERDNPVGQAAVLLSGGSAAIQAAAAAVGLHYRYDAEHDQFAHPAAVYVVDGGGRVARVLSALGLNGIDLKLAIVDAGNGAIGTFADRIHLLCYGYDAVHGIYTERITTMLEFAAGVTLVVLAGGILAMHRRTRRRAPL